MTASLLRTVCAPATLIYMEAGTTKRLKHDSEVEVGDIVVFFGTPHRVDRIDPPSDATLKVNPDCIGFARSNDGWGIALSNHLPVSFRQIEVL